MIFSFFMVILSWNAKGLGRLAKRVTIRMLSRFHKVDIAFKRPKLTRWKILYLVCGGREGVDGNGCHRMLLWGSYYHLE